MGAADVIPFIPIEGVTLEDCVAMARRVGEEIWKRYEIPVYLYEAAAHSPERQNLENIRRGQFEGIRDEIATNPGAQARLRRAALHPTAGATVVGARKFLDCLQRFSEHAGCRDCQRRSPRRCAFPAAGCAT